MIAAAFRDLMAKWNATTPRERAGLAAVAAIAALTFMAYAMEWAGKSAESAYSAAQRAGESSATLAAFNNESYRQRLAQEAGNAWRWSQVEDALAGETVLAELDSMSQQAGLGDARVTLVERSSPTAGRVGAIEASVNAEFSWQTFLSLLEAIEGAELNFAVKSIDVAEGEGVQRLTLVVAVPAVAAESER